MDKAKLEVPFSGITGRLDHESETYYTTRLGETDSKCERMLAFAVRRSGGWQYEHREC